MIIKNRQDGFSLLTQADLTKCEEVSIDGLQGLQLLLPPLLVLLLLATHPPCLSYSLGWLLLVYPLVLVQIPRPLLDAELGR